MGVGVLHVAVLLLAVLLLPFPLPPASVAAGAPSYSVRVTRLNAERPIVSSQVPGSSAFTYSYNSAFAPGSAATAGAPFLLVRCQNTTVPNNKYAVGPSVLAFSRLETPLAQLLDPSAPVVVSPLTAASVVMRPDSNATAAGVEDPRVVFDPSTREYLVFYTAVAEIDGTRGEGGQVARLALATCTDPSKTASYVPRGPLFPGVPWSKSGALLLRTHGPSYLIWGDSTLVPGIQIAETYDPTDVRKYRILPGLFLATRKDSFDSHLVESGPPPARLSDGNYFFLYNSARKGYPSQKPNWDIQYNVGWAVLNGSDPTAVLQRSDTPILSPVLSWERGTPPAPGLTPNVVFAEGLVPIPGKRDVFAVVYGAADSAVGIALVEVRATAHV